MRLSRYIYEFAEKEDMVRGIYTRLFALFIGLFRVDSLYSFSYESEAVFV